MYDPLSQLAYTAHVLSQHEAGAPQHPAHPQHEQHPQDRQEASLSEPEGADALTADGDAADSDEEYGYGYGSGPVEEPSTDVDAGAAGRAALYDTSRRQASVGRAMPASVRQPGQLPSTPPNVAGGGGYASRGREVERGPSRRHARSPSGEGRETSYGGGGGGAAMSGGGSKRACNRRPVQFWGPFNDWWRSEFERSGKRPGGELVCKWYQAHAAATWGPEAPSLDETRTHAKCLRSVGSIREYFRSYRARKKARLEDAPGSGTPTGATPGGSGLSCGVPAAAGLPGLAALSALLPQLSQLSALGLSPLQMTSAAAHPGLKRGLPPSSPPPSLLSFPDLDALAASGYGQGSDGGGRGGFLIAAPASGSVGGSAAGGLGSSDGGCGVLPCSSAAPLLYGAAARIGAATGAPPPSSMGRRPAAAGEGNQVTSGAVAADAEAIGSSMGALHALMGSAAPVGAAPPAALRQSASTVTTGVQPLGRASSGGGAARAPYRPASVAVTTAHPASDVGGGTRGDADAARPADEGGHGGGSGGAGGAAAAGAMMAGAGAAAATAGAVCAAAHASGNASGGPREAGEAMDTVPTPAAAPAVVAAHQQQPPEQTERQQADAAAGAFSFHIGSGSRPLRGSGSGCGSGSDGGKSCGSTPPPPQPAAAAAAAAGFPRYAPQPKLPQRGTPLPQQLLAAMPYSDAAAVVHLTMRASQGALAGPGQVPRRQVQHVQPHAHHPVPYHPLHQHAHYPQTQRRSSYPRDGGSSTPTDGVSLPAQYGKAQGGPGSPAAEQLNGRGRAPGVAASPFAMPASSLTLAAPALGHAYSNAADAVEVEGPEHPAAAAGNAGERGPAGVRVNDLMDHTAAAAAVITHEETAAAAAAAQAQQQTSQEQQPPANQQAAAHFGRSSPKALEAAAVAVNLLGRSPSPSARQHPPSPPPRPQLHQLPPGHYPRQPSDMTHHHHHHRHLQHALYGALPPSPTTGSPRPSGHLPAAAAAAAASGGSAPPSLRSLLTRSDSELHQVLEGQPREQLLQLLVRSLGMVRQKRAHEERLMDEYAQVLEQQGHLQAQIHQQRMEMARMYRAYVALRDERGSSGGGHDALAPPSNRLAGTTGAAGPVAAFTATSAAGGGGSYPGGRLSPVPARSMHPGCFMGPAEEEPGSPHPMTVLGLHQHLQQQQQQQQQQQPSQSARAAAASATAASGRLGDGVAQGGGGRDGDKESAARGGQGAREQRPAEAGAAQAPALSAAAAAAAARSSPIGRQISDAAAAAAAAAVLAATAAGEASVNRAWPAEQGAEHGGSGFLGFARRDSRTHSPPQDHHSAAGGADSHHLASPPMLPASEAGPQAADQRLVASGAVAEKLRNAGGGGGGGGVIISGGGSVDGSAAAAGAAKAAVACSDGGSGTSSAF